MFVLLVLGELWVKDARIGKGTFEVWLVPWLDDIVGWWISLSFSIKYVCLFNGGFGPFGFGNLDWISTITNISQKGDFLLFCFLFPLSKNTHS